MTKAGLMRNGSYDGDTGHAYRNGQSWTSKTMRVSWPSIRVVHARDARARLIPRRTAQLPDSLPATSRLVEESGRRVETLVEGLLEESGRRVETLVEVLVEEIGGWVEIPVEKLGELVQKNIQGTMPVFFGVQIVVEDE